MPASVQATGVASNGPPLNLTLSRLVLTSQIRHLSLSRHLHTARPRHLPSMMATAPRALVLVAAALLAAPAAGFYANPTMPLRIRPVAAPAVRLAEADVPPQWKAARPPYFLNKGPRPQWRGRMMGWLHNTRVWYLIAIAYLAAARLIPTKYPLSPRELLLRILAAAASSANVYISDGYHNSDKRGPADYTATAELRWLRLDYLGISCVLTTLFWLWSSNLNFVGRLGAGSWATGVSTALVAVLARLWVPQKAGHTTVKLIMTFQFLFLLGYLALFTVCPACTVNKIIFGVYAPGLLLYAIKWPKSDRFGFHEYFHTSVIAGHLASMAFDLRDIVSPCARIVCGA